MVIDPQAKAFLDDIESLNLPPFHSLTADKARAMVAADGDPSGPPEPVAKIEDRTVVGPECEIPIRVYVPEGAGPFPVFLYYHGGGWVLGEVSTHDGICCQIANAVGCLVVSVDYRLAPENKYPAAVEDAYAATQWVAQNAPAINGDPGRIAVGGDSAGGNLAAAVCLMARDRASFQPSMQVLIYPITDHNLDTPSYRDNAQGYFLTRDTMRWFWQCYLARQQDGDQQYASPLRAVDLSRLPAALVITAEYDPLRDEGEAYANRLRQAGVPVTLTRYEGMIHAFIRRTGMFDKAKLAMREVCDSLRQAFANSVR